MRRSIPGLRDLSAEGWHRRLVALVRGRSRARVELGRAMDSLARKSGHHEMGFSSVAAYVVQQTGLGARFVAQSRALARRLFGEPGLPVLAEALGTGEVSWSAAERVARALVRRAKRAPERLDEDERAAVEAAKTMTVRRLEQWLAALGREDQSGQPAQDAQPAQDEATPPTSPDDPDRDPDRYLLERPMDPSERALYEATRQLITFLDGPVSDEEFVTALLAEAHDSMAGSTSLARAMRRESQHRDWADAHSDVLQALELERQRQEERTAAATEARVERLRAARGHQRASAHTGPVEWNPLEGLTIAELDARVRDLAEQITARDLAMAEAALVVNAARVWRRLGWNSRDQYAREELGMSARSFRALVLRAQRMLELPELQAAVADGALGLEAACAIGRVATLDTVDQWIERAGHRTFVHLREEVRAVEMLERNGAPTDLGPPSDAQLEQVRDFERSVASGEWFETLVAEPVDPDNPDDPDDPDRQMCAGPEQDRQMCAGPGSGGGLDPGRRSAPRHAALVFAGPPGEASERLRLRISDEQAGWWRYLERAYGAHERRLRKADGQGMSFVAFACLSVWMTWYPAVKQTGMYDRWTSIYVRDRYQCSSPVCTRRDVTPHHLRFQSHGGGHDSENVAALCSWCHLEGIHGGRITARPPASSIHWRLGREGGLEVRGRELAG